MWIERLVRFGYATKGTVYGLVGLLALMAAFSSQGKTTDTQGALQTIAVQPFGQLLLVFVTVGLLGYALWRFIQVVQNPENKGTGAKGIFSRIGYAISGFAYAGLALNSALLAMGSGGTGSGSSKQDWTARLLAQPFGQWLVGTIGAFVIGLGCYRLYRAYREKFRQQLDLNQLSPTQRRWAIGISRSGVVARGLVFGIIGWFLLRAAQQSDASKVQGLDGVLQALARQPFGKFVLGFMAIGLVAYGIHQWIQARYRRINT